MADTVTVRIGLQSVRELEIEVEDADTVVNAITAAMSVADPVAWITDAKGTRHGIAVDKLGFIGVEGAEDKTVGFG